MPGRDAADAEVGGQRTAVRDTDRPPHRHVRHASRPGERRGAWRGAGRAKRAATESSLGAEQHGTWPGRAETRR